MRHAFLMLVLLATPAWSAGAAQGRAYVIDGDTLDIHGQRFRLHGVDAPESGQYCLAQTGSWQPCGRTSAFALQDFIGTDVVSCEARDRPSYGRTVAECFVRGTSINRWLARQGLAVAVPSFTMAYVPDEMQARSASVGIWATRFTEPYRWRKGQRLPGEPGSKKNG